MHVHVHVKIPFHLSKVVLGFICTHLCLEILCQHRLNAFVVRALGAEHATHFCVIRLRPFYIITSSRCLRLLLSGSETRSMQKNILCQRVCASHCQAVKQLPLLSDTVNAQLMNSRFVHGSVGGSSVGWRRPENGVNLALRSLVTTLLTLQAALTLALLVLEALESRALT